MGKYNSKFSRTSRKQLAKVEQGVVQRCELRKETSCAKLKTMIYFFEIRNPNNIFTTRTSFDLYFYFMQRGYLLGSV